MGTLGARPGFPFDSRLLARVEDHEQRGSRESLSCSSYTYRTANRKVTKDLYPHHAWNQSPPFYHLSSTFFSREAES